MHQLFVQKHMQNRKKIQLTALLLISTSLLCGCTPKGDTSMYDIQHEATAVTIGPTKEFDKNDLISTATGLLDAVTDSYGKMHAAVNESTSNKAKKAVENVENLYAERIETLKNEDFSNWSEEDLSDLSTELSYMITAIREARDLINFQ